MNNNRQVDISTQLDEWTWETVIAMVTKHEFEPGIYDYKDVLYPTGEQKQKNEHNDSIRKTACSMANTSGGFILFGVLDRKKSISSLPEDRVKELVVGIPTKEDLRKQFGDKLQFIQPEIYFDAKLLRLPDDESRGIFVVHIPQSQRRPHMLWLNDLGIYYRRGDGGQAISMRDHEVREQMMNTEERLRKVALLRLEIRQYVELTYMMLGEGDAVVQMLYRFDTSAFKVLLADICSLLPASGNLVPLLLRIPMQATMINNYLEITSSPTMPSLMNAPDGFYDGHIQGIRTNLKNFQRYCTMCQNRLDALFGPLGMNEPVTYKDTREL